MQCEMQTAVLAHARHHASRIAWHPSQHQMDDSGRLPRKLSKTVPHMQHPIVVELLSYILHDTASAHGTCSARRSVSTKGGMFTTAACILQFFVVLPLLGIPLCPWSSALASPETGRPCQRSAPRQHCQTPRRCCCRPAERPLTIRHRRHRRRPVGRTTLRAEHVPDPSSRASPSAADKSQKMVHQYRRRNR